MMCGWWGSRGVWKVSTQGVCKTNATLLAPNMLLGAIACAEPHFRGLAHCLEASLFSCLEPSLFSSSSPGSTEHVTTAGHATRECAGGKAGALDDVMLHGARWWRTEGFIECVLLLLPLSPLVSPSSPPLSFPSCICV